jgi:hypothetical protein
MLLKMATFFENCANNSGHLQHGRCVSASWPLATSHLAPALLTLSSISEEFLKYRYLPFSGVARLSAISAIAMSLAVMPPASCVTSDTVTLL